jgi:hypothetical protein
MMYLATDPRASLAPAAAKAPVPTAFQGAEYACFREQEPTERDALHETWYARGQNLVVAYSDCRAGAELTRSAQPDEYVLMIPDRDAAVIVEAEGERREVEGFSIVMIPPGTSRITVQRDARLVRFFTTQSADLAALCSNAESYASPDPNVPPFQPWPTPKGGYRLRSYSLDVPKQPGRFGRIFRCSTIMVNFLDGYDGPRDVAKLSPHHHDDFEQYSLVLSGAYTHHLRWPWTPDMRIWREDEHVTCGTPSVTVIPPPSIHTSQAMDAGFNQLVDIFSPPRHDFSDKPGWVLNAGDYPMP